MPGRATAHRNTNIASASAQPQGQQASNALDAPRRPSPASAAADADDDVIAIPRQSHSATRHRRGPCQELRTLDKTQKGFIAVLRRGTAQRLFLDLWKTCGELYATWLSAIRRRGVGRTTEHESCVRAGRVQLARREGPSDERAAARWGGGGPKFRVSSTSLHCGGPQVVGAPELNSLRSCRASVRCRSDPLGRAAAA